MCNTIDKEERWRYPRFFCDKIAETAVISGGDAKHICSVLRMKIGEKLVACDKNGTDFLCKLISTDNSLCEATVISSQPNEAEPDINITIYQCVPKTDKMDFIVQKATELGASKVVPILSKRCVSRPDSKSSEKKIQRWKKIAEEAAKQCGRGKIPEIGDLVSFSKAISSYSSCGTGILFYECGGAPLAEIIAEKPHEISIFIGSEGGFEQDEALLAEKNGIHLATLGKRILRCETAPIAALSILMNLTGNM